MKIYRLKTEIVKQNKKINSRVFSSSDRFVDKVDLDECLLKELLKEDQGKTEIFSTSDLIMVEFKDNPDIIRETIILDNIEYMFYISSPNMLKKSCALFVRVDREELYKSFIISYSLRGI